MDTLFASRTHADKEIHFIRKWALNERENDKLPDRKWEMLRAIADRGGLTHQRRLGSLLPPCNIKYEPNEVSSDSFE